ncbi:MAG TPA: hypothetical protein ENJ56_09285 [Anaerolineae bacterium]|nr:hypothetical protein [Anaerolineae bacterium]
MNRRTYLAVFRHVMLLWAAGKISHPDFQSWQEFRATVARGLQQVTSQMGRGQTALVFTSGGTIAAATGQTLELSNLKTIGLNWVVLNSSFTTFYYREQALLLAQFNALPHIEDEALQTYV